MGSHYHGTEDEIRSLTTYIKLIRAAETVEARVTEHLIGSGITAPQLGVLEALYHLGPMRLCDLAAKHLRSRGTLTVVVDNLERVGLVYREASLIDRRSITVHLTDTGRQIVERILPEQVSNIISAMSVLTPSQQESIGRLCKKLGTANAPVVTPAVTRRARRTAFEPFPPARPRHQGRMMHSTAQESELEDELVVD